MSHRPWIILFVMAASLLSGVPVRASVPKVVFGEDFTAAG